MRKNSGKSMDKFWAMTIIKDIFMNIFKDVYQSELSVHQKMALDNCIALYTVGSNLYGTATSTSDLDLEGIFIEPPVNVLGFNHYDVLELFDGIKDIKLYSLQKFIAAALKNSLDELREFQSILLRGISEGKTKIGELFTNNIFVSDIECKYNIY